MSSQIICKNEKELIKAAEDFARSISPGDLIELVGDVGAGKTTFVKGLSNGLGINEHVTSPSFALENIYRGKNFELHHLDLYRLDDAGLIKHEITEALNKESSVLVIEWAGVAEDILPTKRKIIHITAQADGARKIEFKK